MSFSSIIGDRTRVWVQNRRSHSAAGGEQRDSSPIRGREAPIRD
jgi:hypothetical protein